MLLGFAFVATSIVFVRGCFSAVKTIFFRIKNCWLDELVNKTLIAKTLLHSCREGEINTKTLTDFIMFELRLKVSQKLGTGLLKSVGKTYELTYYDGDRMYKIRFPKNRGVRQISQVETPSGKDITKEINFIIFQLV